MNELIYLALSAEDERVRSVCCVAVLDRAYGRPREAVPEDSSDDRFARMSRKERWAFMESLLAPMRKYLEAEENEAEVEAETTIEGGSSETDPAGRRGDGRNRLDR